MIRRVEQMETALDHGETRSAVSVYASAAILVTTAVASLYSYRLSARLYGPAPTQAVTRLQRWCRTACARLRLELRVHGTPAKEPRVYVANHRSYLDIPVLSAVLGATFVSRGDVSTWPLIGAVAKAIDVVFVERNDTRARVRAARALRSRVGALNLVVFPEGTTGAERLPGPFHAGLFRLLHRLGTPLVPVTIRYNDRRAYWTEQIGLWHHLRTRVFAGPGLVATVHVGDELHPQAHSDGASLAQAALAAVCQPIQEFGESA